LAALDGELQSVDGLDESGVGIEDDLELVDRKHGAHTSFFTTPPGRRGLKRRERGSKASRTPSANRFAASTRLTMKKNAAANDHHTVGSRAISLRDRLIIPPKLF